VYLLDTNHCSRLIDRDPGVLQRLRELGDARVATCVVVRGELRFMVERSERRRENAAKVEALLRDMEVFPLDDAAADLYGQMKARLLSAWGPRERRARRRARLDTLGVSDNDLWIAAIAKGIANINALRALVPPPLRPVPRPSRPQPRTPHPRRSRRHSAHQPPGAPTAPARL
jgi:tRNA(fMet)-specific endonuclease VapC